MLADRERSLRTRSKARSNALSSPTAGKQPMSTDGLGEGRPELSMAIIVRTGKEAKGERADSNRKASLGQTCGRATTGKRWTGKKRHAFSGAGGYINFRRVRPRREWDEGLIAVAVCTPEWCTTEARTHDELAAALPIACRRFQSNVALTRWRYVYLRN